jgi:hypothetical protein
VGVGEKVGVDGKVRVSGQLKLTGKVEGHGNGRVEVGGEIGKVRVVEKSFGRVGGRVAEDVAIGGKVEGRIGEGTSHR